LLQKFNSWHANAGNGNSGNQSGITAVRSNNAVHTRVNNYKSMLPKAEILKCWSRWFIKEQRGAGNETRTRDLDLGKVALYQLSYARITRILFYG
jgi:hypothetical protein